MWCSGNILIQWDINQFCSHEISYNNRALIDKLGLCRCITNLLCTLIGHKII